MRTYVLICNISDKKSEKEFLGHLENKFLKHKFSTKNNIQYFAFAAKELAAIQDTLQNTLDRLNLTDADYIALYYTREEEPDEIKRLMIFGKWYQSEKDLSRLNEDTIAELLEFDFVN
jgi:hypothetical protein